MQLNLNHYDGLSRETKISNFTGSIYNNKRINFRALVNSNTLSTMIDSITINSQGKDRFSFYLANSQSPQTLLDSINFYKGPISGGGTDGLFQFGNDGYGQCIPVSAIDRINTSSLQKLRATHNELVLTSNSYYSYSGSDGKSYAWAFNGETIQRAFSEFILNNDKDNISTRVNQESVKTSCLISSLATGKGIGYELSRGEIKEYLGSVGIKPGEFKMSVDGKSRTYYLGEDGSVRSEKEVQDLINVCNEQTWFTRGRQVGDTVTVFGKDYTIDETGHIHVPKENFWENEQCDLFKTK